MKPPVDAPLPVRPTKKGLLAIDMALGTVRPAVEHRDNPHKYNRWKAMFLQPPPRVMFCSVKLVPDPEK